MTQLSRESVCVLLFLAQNNRVLCKKKIVPQTQDEPKLFFNVGRDDIFCNAIFAFKIGLNA